MQRGRKSAAQLAVLPTIGGERPKPPTSLTATQKRIWEQVAATKPADWFNADTFPLLAQYCRHIESANQIAAQIDAIPADQLTDKVVLARYDHLLKIRQRESKSIIEMATCMRLTQASRMRAETSRDAANLSTDKPWQAAS